MSKTDKIYGVPPLIEVIFYKLFAICSGGLVEKRVFSKSIDSKAIDPNFQKFQLFLKVSSFWQKIQNKMYFLRRKHRNLGFFGQKPPILSLFRLDAKSFFRSVVGVWLKNVFFQKALILRQLVQTFRNFNFFWRFPVFDKKSKIKSFFSPPQFLGGRLPALLPAPPFLSFSAAGFLPSPPHHVSPSTFLKISSFW